MKTQLIDTTQSEVLELAGRVFGAVRQLPPAALDDLKHAAETIKKENPSPSRRVAGYIVADCCAEAQKERRQPAGGQ